MNNYQTLLEMWREEKKKNEELRKELEEVRADNKIKKLEKRINELEEDNKKLAVQIEDQVERARKAGL
jgi:superfamily I DNA and RNA helicase